MSSEVGDVELAVPRDRDGTFTPQLVPKGSRRLGGLDEMIISLYAGGMTVRDIAHDLGSTIGTELSHETIAKITDEVAVEVLAWQRRPLEPLYPVVYLDALVVKVCDRGHVRNKAAYRGRGRPGRNQARAGDLGADQNDRLIDSWRKAKRSGRRSSSRRSSALRPRAAATWPRVATINRDHNESSTRRRTG